MTNGKQEASGEDILQELINCFHFAGSIFSDKYDP